MLPNNKLLKGITIIDLGQRLPGPYASYLLQKLGAKVIKIEDIRFGDPFDSKEFKKIDPSYHSWYKNLNAKKEIIKLDFNSSKDKSKIKKIIKKADAIILGIPKKVLNSIGLDKINEKIVVLNLFAHPDKKTSLHDLNALTTTGLIKLHLPNHANKKIVNPPMLPIAGIGFGQLIALSTIAGILKSKLKKKKISIDLNLLDSTKLMLTPFWGSELQERDQFLHNGAFPCYCIYQTKDKHYVSVAAVEEKYWMRFSELFHFKLDNRFSRNKKSFEIVLNAIQSKTKKEIEKLIQNENICVNLVN